MTRRLKNTFKYIYERKEEEEKTKLFPHIFLKCHFEFKFLFDNKLEF